MNESALMIVLRLVHIFSGIFWAGTAALLAWFILPAQTALGQAGAAFMMDLMLRRRLRAYLMTAMILTLLSGIAMYAYLAMTTHGMWARSTTAMVLGVGAVVGIIAGGIGGSIGSATAKKMAQLGATIQAAGGQATDAQRAEMAMLQARSHQALRIVSLLLIITIAAMASARYL
ncbi:MAG: hypothetical protein ABJB49_09855 [Nitrospirota bacterium]